MSCSKLSIANPAITLFGWEWLVNWLIDILPLIVWTFLKDMINSFFHFSSDFAEKNCKSFENALFCDNVRNCGASIQPD